MGRVTVYRNAIARNSFEHLLKHKKGRAIFNPDRKRLQSNVSRKDPIRDVLHRFLRQKRKLKNRFLSDIVVLHSMAGCQKQQWHCDYDPERVKTARQKPFGLMLALQDNTKFELPDKTIALAQGDVLTFDGDVVHAGAAYAEPNSRLHAYVDAFEIERAKNKTWRVDM